MTRASIAVGLAFAGLLAGCGETREFQAPATVTLPAKSVHTGDNVTCKNGDVSARAQAPSPGHGMGTVADGTSSSVQVALTRRTDGSLVVECRT
jgi:hypothetical protein